VSRIGSDEICDTPEVTLGPSELIIVMLIVVVPAVCILTAVDAGSQPDWAFEAAGTGKALWIALPIVGVFLFFVGVIAVLVWFIAYRPRVRAAVKRGREATSIA
jgi:uncharacterized membrane protein